MPGVPEPVREIMVEAQAGESEYGGGGMRGKKRNTPWEHIEQCQLMAWVGMVAMEHPEIGLLNATFNPGKLTIWKAKYLKAEGAKSGFPDLHLPIARNGYHSLYIEMKSKVGTVSPIQKEVFADLKRHGNCVSIARSAREAAFFLVEYLDIEYPLPAPTEKFRKAKEKK